MKQNRIELIAEKTSPPDAEQAYKAAIEALKTRKLTVSTAESCTGGLIGKLFTDISGASAVFSGGMITYTNHIKIHKLGVSEKTIEEHTEVSFECASEMAIRTRELFETDIGISATGFAGPGGGNHNDPVGTVYLGIAAFDEVTVYRLSFGNVTRDEVRFGTAKLAAEMLICAINPTKIAQTV